MFRESLKGFDLRVVCWTLLLLSMVVVGWIRLLPQAPDLVGNPARGITRDALAPETDANARRRQSEMTYIASDGREHVYLGDFDSYLWLRHARNQLRTGSPCDAVIDGTCRDTYTNAPVGASTRYARSLHVAAIAAVHQAVTWFAPSFPLPASAFLVPVIAGLLGVAPAFFIAHRLAGPTAGVLAGVLTALHPVVLTRTIGGDNDVWNVVLPLYAVWATTAALDAGSPRLSALWAAMAGAAIGLQAWAWRGWLFTYVVVVTGLLATAVAYAVRDAIQQRTWRIWRSLHLRRVALVLGILYVAGGAAVTLSGSEEAYFSIPLEAVGTFIRAIFGPVFENAGAPDDWPSTLTSVSELLPLGWWEMARGMGGTALSLTSLGGLLLLLLPADRWRWRHYVVFGVAAVIYGCTLLAIEPSRGILLGLLIAPLAAALATRGSVDQSAARVGLALIVIVWFLVAVMTAFDGLRFLLLLSTPFGIACAVFVGRVDQWLRGLIRVMPGWYRPVSRFALVVVLALAFLHPVHWGYTSARSYVPIMRDVWWDGLTHLRETADPDSIVHTWWDYGHWVKYVAERRVSNDGTSLLTHVPHWLARALAAPTEAQSVGVLRMLTCSSDATPLPEGAQGAYGKLRASGRDPRSAYNLVSSLSTLNKAAAASHLDRHGFTQSERDEVLRSTHCDPAESYLVLSTAMLDRRRTWMALGLWDPRKMTGAGLSPAGEPPPVLFVSNWLPCHAAQGGKDMDCDVRWTMNGEGSMLHSLTYSSTAQAVRLQFRGRRGGSPGDMIEGTPAAIVVAGARNMERIDVASPTHPELAVLVDEPGTRILVGAPAFLQSTFVHLMYLDGRYARHYRKHDERAGLNERVVTWKIGWE